ncbi:MAG: NAD(P)/FAD-dependent oxidoreductase [Clostridiaceae bacterium]|nr:NAD(P)/FAD-dependent oxidoreductase [Clostridiaceae bacterium]
MFDVTIIGAGVIGCSIARELCKYKLEICVLEKSEDVGTGTSKANSGIVHAGFDTRPESLKGKLNVKGNLSFDLLARELDFPFKRIGALVLCFDEKDLYKLEELKLQGELNGVWGLQILTPEKIKEMEPNVTDNVVGALYAPSSGICCPYEMTIALAENAYENGVEFKFLREVKNIEKIEGKYIIKTLEENVESKVVINAAGMFADEINNMVSKEKIIITPRKGEYCLFDKAAGGIVYRTIFQLPTFMGKGVLVTPTVDGNLLIGPNAVDLEDKLNLDTSKEGLEEILYKANSSIKDVPIGELISSFTGLRAHSLIDDFIIGEPMDAEGFINAAGIESPGLSSAPAIGEYIKEIVVSKLKPELNSEFRAKRKGIKKFREMSNIERIELIAKRPEYGRIICRCETISEGEIMEAINRPLGAKTLDGVKRRTRALMGRCQAGFCTTKIVDILARELNISVLEVTKCGGKSNILVSRNKEDI